MDLSEESMSVKKTVQKKLEGLEDRQATREAAREAARMCASMLRHVYACRRKGYLDNYDDALVMLAHVGISYTVQGYYGCKLVRTTVGITLCYRPDGQLDWASAPRYKDEGPEQIEMFTDETPAVSSARSF